MRYNAAAEGLPAEIVTEVMQQFDEHTNCCVAGYWLVIIQ
jgi:hypothetical protein